MNRTASALSFWISGLLFLVVIGSFGIAVHRHIESDSTEAREASIKAAENGQVTVGDDNDDPTGFTLLVMSLAGAGFLVAGFALRPKMERPLSEEES